MAVDNLCVKDMGLDCIHCRIEKAKQEGRDEREKEISKILDDWTQDYNDSEIILRINKVITSQNHSPLSTGKDGSLVTSKAFISGEEPICKPETLGDTLSKEQVAQAIEKVMVEGTGCCEIVVKELKKELGISPEEKT